MKKLILIILLVACNKIIKNLDIKNKGINEELAKAVRKGKKDKAIKLINEGADINFYHHNITTLGFLIYYEDLDVIKAIVEKKININEDKIRKICDLALKSHDYKLMEIIQNQYDLENIIENKKYFLFLCYSADQEKIQEFAKENEITSKEFNDALVVASLKGRTKIVELLIKKYNVNIETNHGNKALVMAITNGHIETVKLLLDKGADFKTVDKTTLLMLASNENEKNIVELLIERGCDVNSKNSLQEIALLLAVEKGNVEVVRLLTDRGINFNFDNKMTMLMLSSKKNHKNIVELLIKKGCDINYKDSSKETALSLAIEKGNIEIVKLLIENGAIIEEKYKVNFIDSVDFDDDLVDFLDSAPTKIDSLLIKAVESGNKKIVKLLLEKGIDINARDRIDKTAVMYSAEKGQLKILELLVKKNANIHEKDKNGNTLLILASEKGHIEIVNFLIKNGCNINIKNKNNCTALVLAIKAGHAKIVKLLLDNGANIQDKYENDKEDATLLMLAAYYRYKYIVELLLEKDCDINAKNKNGETPLSLALSTFGLGKYNEEVANLLLEKGADYYGEEKYNKRVLMRAAKCGYEKVIKLLIDKGYNINVQKKNGDTALVEAIEFQRDKVAKLLIENGANISYKSEHSSNLLMIASGVGRVEIVKLLLEKGIDVNDKNEYGNTALMNASWVGDKELLELLLDKGADINVKDEKGITALIRASSRPTNEIAIKLLIERGANVNDKDESGKTVLIYLIRNGYANLVRIALEKGANINEENGDHCTPLINACRISNFELVKILIEEGADINFKSKMGWTALELALGNEEGCERSEIIAFLLEKGDSIENYPSHFNKILSEIIYKSNSIKILLYKNDFLNIDKLAFIYKNFSNIKREELKKRLNKKIIEEINISSLFYYDTFLSQNKTLIVDSFFNLFNLFGLANLNEVKGIKSFLIESFIEYYNNKLNNAVNYEKTFIEKLESLKTKISIFTTKLNSCINTFEGENIDIKDLLNKMDNDNESF